MPGRVHFQFALMDGQIELAASTAILLEDEEVAAGMNGPVFARR